MAPGLVRRGATARQARALGPATPATAMGWAVLVVIAVARGPCLARLAESVWVWAGGVLDG